MSFDRFTLLVRRLAAVLFWPALLLVIWGELSAVGGVPELTLWDKLLHFTAYFGLALIAALAVRAGRSLISIVFALLVLGGVLEIVQGFLGRDADINDEIANAIGTACGALGGWALMTLRARLVARGSRP